MNENQIYNDGRHACKAGLSLDNNPYKIDCEWPNWSTSNQKYLDWKRGFESMRVELENKPIKSSLACVAIEIRKAIKEEIK